MSAGDAYAALGYITAGLFLALAAACAVAILRRRPVPGLPGDGKGCMTEDEFVDFLIIALEAGETIPGPERTP